MRQNPFKLPVLLTFFFVMTAVSAQDREILCIPELPDDYDFDKTYTAVIDWCQKTFARIR